jgi:hypothetical protein
VVDAVAAKFQQALTMQQALSLGGDIEPLPGLGLDPAGHAYAWVPDCTGSVSAHVAGMGCVCKMEGRADSSKHARHVMLSTATLRVALLHTTQATPPTTATTLSTLL